MKLTHIDENGRARMVDVGEKPDTKRMAVAKGEVVMRPETLRCIAEGRLPKGDALAIAQIAGTMAAKRTPELIPMCHPLFLNQIDVKLHIDEKRSRVVIKAIVRSWGKTGVEMEALTAVSVAALTLYDMVKAVEKTVRISDIRLVEKHGGKSGSLVLEDKVENDE